MCKVSRKIKFCTCAARDPYGLKHFWRLHRYVGDKKETILGEPISGFEMEEELSSYNSGVLLQRLNEGDAFDVALDLQEGDRLLVSFSCGPAGERLAHGFAFEEGAWCAATYEVFEWMNEYEEAQFGKMINALDRK